MTNHKNPARVEAGHARARALKPERRSEIARVAAMTRWADEGKPQPILAKYGAADRPLKIGDIDPRSDPASCHEISDKSLAVGGGVVEAVLTWLNRAS